MAPNTKISDLFALISMLFLVSLLCKIVHLLVQVQLSESITFQYQYQCAIIIGLCLLGTRIAYPNFKPFNTVYRMVASITILYLVAAYYNATATTFTYPDLRHTIVWIEPLVIGLGVWGVLKRPVLGFVPIAYFVVKRSLMNKILGFHVDGTDWYVIVDVGTFLILGYVLYLAYLSLVRKCGLKNGLLKKDYLAVLVLFSMAIHLSNYFFSGAGKMVIGDGGPLDWVLYNQTSNLLLGFREIGTHVVLSTDYLAATVYKLLQPLDPISNATILILQLASIGILINKNASKLLVLFYDVTHVVIFALSGIFFWKWILLNLAYYKSISALHTRWFKAQIMLPMACVMLLAPLFFSVAVLAWFDTKNVNNAMFSAITQSGERIRVPNAYFLDFALTLNQTRFSAPYAGHFKDVLINITTKNEESMRQANACNGKLSDKSPNIALLNQPQVDIIRRHHKYILSKVNNRGHFNYFLYPHHKFSNPIQFADFFSLDLRTIVAYEFTVESSCLGFSNNMFTKKVMATSKQRIPL